VKIPREIWSAGARRLRSVVASARSARRGPRQLRSLRLLKGFFDRAKSKYDRLARYFLQLFLIHVEIRIDVLDVVVIFNRFQQADHLAGGRALQLDVVLRDHP